VDSGALEEKKRSDLSRLLDVVKLAKSADVRGYIMDYFQLEETGG
jgi:hypothetical protein